MMRNHVVRVIVGFMVLPALLTPAMAQQQSARPHGVPQGGANIAGRLGADPGGPAPRHDLSGAWAGGGGGGERMTPPPWETLMTAWGLARYKANKPEGTTSEFSVAESNDPTRTCDPAGFPRNVLWNNRAISFAQMPDRIIQVFQYQRVWREIFTDGRALPANVGGKDGPDPRYYGYSVGRWEGDDTFVVDTTDTDERTWLDNSGHPHSNELRVEERYTRADHNDLQLTVTLNDPKAYTKPFIAMKTNFRWLPKQEFEEQLCVPSEGLAYLSAIANPAGNADGSPAATK
jgi:hypothetical protein